MTNDMRARLNALSLEMTAFYSGEPARIQHFVKVHAFSRLIAELEGVDEATRYTLEAAAYVHDIGIKPADAKHGSHNGKLQELEGPPVAREMMIGLGFERDVTERVCWLVGHHHTYDNIDAIDYQILVEADFLVNLFEGGADAEKVANVLKNIFRTSAGTRICRDMFRAGE